VTARLVFPRRMTRLSFLSGFMTSRNSYIAIY
jgi:hypothetical protein